MSKALVNSRGHTLNNGDAKISRDFAAVNQQSMPMIANQNYLLHIPALVVASLLLTGCVPAPTTQNTDNILSIEQAREITPTFATSNYARMPRGIDDIRNEFGSPGPVPGNCQSIRRARAAEFGNAINRMRNASDNLQMIGSMQHVLNAAERAIVAGRYRTALARIADARGDAPYAFATAILYSMQARVLARLNDIEGANAALQGFTLAASEARHSGESWLDTPRGKAHRSAALGAVAAAEGNLTVAEQSYRNVVRNSELMQRGEQNVPRNEMRSAHVSVLLQQRRVTEAEFAARNAVKKIGLGPALAYANWPPTPGQATKRAYEIPEYNGQNAGPLIMLSAVLLEQRRLDDALYLARIAVNMHERDCSQADSLGLNRARAILVEILAEQGQWSDVLMQIGEIRSAMSTHETLFNNTFGSMIDYAEAQIRAGSVDTGIRTLNSIASTTTNGQPHTATETAIHDALRAVGSGRLGNRNAAVRTFSAALPLLERAAGNGSRDARQLRRIRRLLTDYENELDRLVNDDIQQIGEVHVPTELLRVANLRRIGQVQRALTLSGIRAATGNAELAALIRKQQDLEQEAEAVSENLAHLRFSPDAASQVVPARALDARLQKLRQASAVLENDIHERFPKYAELSNPRPIEIARLSAALLRDQALLVVRVKDDRSYVWVIRSNAQIGFHVVAQGKEAMSAKVAALRDAVDPGAIETLGDIPAFDLSAAHHLYQAFLEPVAPHWRDASELLVVADSPLNQIPLSMLVTAPPRQADSEQLLFQRYSQVDWLVRSIALVQLPSVNTLAEIAARASARTLTASNPFAGFGDPVFNNQDDNKSLSRGATLLRGLLPVSQNNPARTRGVRGLATLPPLPDTRQEILSVAQSLGADLRKDVFLGARANESSVRSADLKSYRFLSFATHGLIPGDLEGLTETALALSNPTLAGVAGDGLLTSSEIMGLQLDADLAVLSACNTAAADGEGAEAISGLGKAFFYAGARSLLVSNWPVHSESTTALMSALFGTLADQSAIARSEALRRTKVQMIDTMGYVHQGKLAFSYAHPIFWAAFSLVGDGGSRRSAINDHFPPPKTAPRRWGEHS